MYLITNRIKSLVIFYFDPIIVDVTNKLAQKRGLYATRKRVFSKMYQGN